MKNGGMLRRHGFYISLWGGGLPEAWGWAEVQLGQQRLGNDGCVAAKALSGRVFASVMPKKKKSRAVTLRFQHLYRYPRHRKKASFAGARYFFLDLNPLNRKKMAAAASGIPR